jgi:hypothetical protein
MRFVIVNVFFIPILEAPFAVFVDTQTLFRIFILHGMVNLHNSAANRV